MSEGRCGSPIRQPIESNLFKNGARHQDDDESDADEPQSGIKSTESSVDNNTEMPGLSDRERLRSDGNDSIGRPEPSKQARRNPNGIKAGINAGPLSRKKPQSHSALRRSDAPTPKSPTRKATRKQSEPKKHRDSIPRAPFQRLVIYFN